MIVVAGHGSGIESRGWPTLGTRPEGDGAKEATGAHEHSQWQLGQFLMGSCSLCFTEQEEEDEATSSGRTWK